MSFRHLIAAAAVAGIALAAVASAAMRVSVAAPTSASVYNIESKWTTQDGSSVALASLGGKPVVAAMGYTTCRNICPAVVADMMWIEKHLPPGTGNAVRFAFFSFDPEVDTPERLTLYAQGHGLDLARWTLLSADDGATRELAQRPGRIRPRRRHLPSRREWRDRLPAAWSRSVVRRTPGQSEQAPLERRVSAKSEAL
jgi:protein SCO1/2